MLNIDSTAYIYSMIGFMLAILFSVTIRYQKLEKFQRVFPYLVGENEKREGEENEKETKVRKVIVLHQ